MAGLPAPGDQAVLRGDMASDKFTLFYLRDGAVRAAHTVNRPAEHMLARKLIALGARIAPELLADPSADLKSFSTPPRPAG
jgi:3-phenylpropionate/trans-cinnamate dioxygenase ferredoxin reductase subunit